MVENNQVGEGKTQGKFSLSIGTSLAVETLFGINDLVPASNPLPYTKYEYLFVNIRTLVRNLYNAVQKELKVTWTRDHYLREIMEELMILPEIINDQSKGKLGLVYYINSYKSLQRQYPSAILKQSKTVSQKLYDDIEEHIVKHVQLAVRNNQIRVMLNDMSITLPEKTMGNLLLTHIAVDLVPFARTRRVQLLESHTGIIKDAARWYTKLNGKELERIPFGEFSIQVYGDGKHFAGLPFKYKKYLTELANVNKWNQYTGDKLIRMQVSRIKDKEIADVFKALL